MYLLKAQLLTSRIQSQQHKFSSTPQLLFLSLVSVQYFVPGFPTQESMLSLHFELLTTGGIIPVAIEIRQAYCYLYYGIT